MFIMHSHLVHSLVSHIVVAMMFLLDINGHFHFFDDRHLFDDMHWHVNGFVDDSGFTRWHRVALLAEKAND